MAEDKQLKLYYFAFESIFDPVFDSQVIGFLRKMNDRFDKIKGELKLIIVGSINDLFKRIYWQKRKRIKKKLNNRCVFVFKFPYLYKFPYLLGFSIFLNAMICFFVLFFNLRLKKSETVIFHCRTEMGSYILLKLRRFFYKNIKVICDCRGVGSKEIMYKPGIRNKILLSWKIYEIEKFVHINSDYLFCVTEAFKEYILNESKNIIKKIKIIPCCLDTNRFKYNPGLREKIREEMSIKNDDFVILYSGSLNQWQLPGRMIEIFKIFRRVIKNSIFVVLTKDMEEAYKLFIESGLNKDYFIISFKPYNLINKYLLIGDIGLLIREDNDVNRVAFPIKFSEYIRCGVPVLTSISSDVINLVGDYSLGFRLKDFNDDRELRNIAGYIKKNMDYIKSDGYKSKISNAIRKKVDWDYYTDQILEIYKNLLPDNLKSSNN